jgi:dUTP pyrophosphatase
MQVKFKKLHNKAVIPSYATAGDAGLDMVAVDLLDYTEQVVYMTGIAVEIPEGHVGLLFPRSSIRKYQLSLSNSVGVIDSGYRGEVQFTFNKTAGPASYKYKIGERIGQLMIIPYPIIEAVEVNELSDSERGKGGFGSTGK